MEEETITVNDVERSIIQEEAVQEVYPTRRAHLKIRCACGRVTNITEDVVEDGLNWSMIIGNDHYLTLHCDECGSELTMFLDEILDNNESTQESNKE